MDDLEKEYVAFIKIFKTGVLKSYCAPEELKELGDLLKYRRMRETLKDLDVDKIAQDLTDELSELILDLINL